MQNWEGVVGGVFASPTEKKLPNLTAPHSRVTPSRGSAPAITSFSKTRYTNYSRWKEKVGRSSELRCEGREKRGAGRVLDEGRGRRLRLEEREERVAIGKERLDNRIEAEAEAEAEQ